jgi:hypothetical protein
MLRALLAGLIFLSLSGCISLKPYQIVYKVKDGKLCSWRELNDKKMICKEIGEFDNTWLFINEQNLKDKFNEIFDRLNKEYSNIK